ncbi:MAG TPA: GNAT family N-acetyltransferase [Clostridia bacterium]
MPDHDYKLSLACPQDAREIYELQLAAYATEALLYDTPIPPMTQTFEASAADLPRWHMLKLVADGRIVGSIRGLLENGICQIGRLMVLPGYRGCGFGTALLDAIEQAFPGVPYELFTGDRSQSNITMYLRHGYTILRADADAGLVFFRKNGQMRP